VVFLKKYFIRVRMTFISENVFHHRHMEALKGRAFDSTLRTLTVLQVGTRSKAILGLFKIARALGVKMVDGRNLFFRIAGSKQLISSTTAARENIILHP